MPRKTGKHVKCFICGKFIYRRKHQLYHKYHYCSRGCYSEARSLIYIGEKAGNFRGGKVPVNCSFCNNILYVPFWKSKQDKIYCNRECQAKGQSKFYSGETASNWQGGDKKIQCNYCGKYFFRQKSCISNKNFCNTKCRCLFNRSRIQVKCYHCGKEFEIWPSQAKLHNYHFCSEDCFYRTNFYGFRIKYKNINFRSGWEANFAKWLDLSGIKWEYEPKGFELNINNKKVKYYPDFYLPEFNCYIEIKGYWRKDAKEKFKEFKIQYKDYNIELFEQNRLKLFGIIKK